jgi:hypothetical protein
MNYADKKAMYNRMHGSISTAGQRLKKLGITGYRKGRRCYLSDDRHWSIYAASPDNHSSRLHIRVGNVVFTQETLADGWQALVYYQDSKQPAPRVEAKA